MERRLKSSVLCVGLKNYRRVQCISWILDVREAMDAPVVYVIGLLGLQIDNLISYLCLFVHNSYLLKYMCWWHVSYTVGIR